jgi:uncharacterized surface protein with fasciclin (FAS1) repeats
MGILILMNCQRDEMLDAKYARPDWLAGKVYDQILEVPDLSVFAKCVELTGYDKIINVSGVYTVFAPSNQAFDTFLSNHPGYNTVEDIPMDELTRIVKYHIVQSPWTKEQLRSLDVFGWIDTLDISNDKPRGFKRETLLLDENQKVGVSSVPEGRTFRVIIVDTLQSNLNRKVIADSRKYAPFFFQEYLNIYDLNKNDYEFYFDRSFDSQDIYFAGAKVISDEIYAENGFVYTIDKVIEPLKNTYQILNDKTGPNQYTDFLKILNLFPRFQYNERVTFDQPGAEQGLKVDSLFDLSYPELIFDINNESTTAPEGTFGLPRNVTLRYHHGLMAPTNEALQSFINEYFRIPQGWGNLENAPIHIKRIIANTHMADFSIYPSDFIQGFLNGEKDIVRLDQENIIEKQFGSNATFIGLNKVVVPRAFSSVTGAVYLQPGFKNVMFAIQKAGLLPALKRAEMNYAFFVESDLNTSLDSSLIYDEINDRFSAVQITEAEGSEVISLTVDDLRNLILNHIAVSLPTGNARKEFLPNLAGNFIIFDNETGEVSGTAPTTEGFRGSVPAPNFPKQLEFVADNGITYEIDNWFSFSTPTLQSLFTSQYPKFHELLVKAGLYLPREYRYSFISDNEFYTVFVPTDSALVNSELSGLSAAQLRQVLLLHFVKGELIFTDGTKLPGYFETERIDEKTTQHSTYFTKIFIDPGHDIITLKGQGGANYVEIMESEKTNRLAGVITGTADAAFPTMYNNAVIHEISKVLRVEELDTN